MPGFFLSCFFRERERTHYRSRKRAPHYDDVAINNIQCILRSIIIILSGDKMRSFSTIKGLPFKITSAEANTRILKSKSIFSVKPGSQEDVMSGPSPTSSHLSACFLPFHSASAAHIISTYVADLDTDRTEVYTDNELVNGKLEQVTKTRVVTDTARHSGQMPPTAYPFGTPDMQFYAAFTFPRDLVENACRTTDVLKGQVITQEMINVDGEKRTVYEHEMHKAFAEEKINSALKELEEERAKKYALKKHGGDRARIVSLNILFHKAKIDLNSYHVAAYIYTQHTGKYTSHTVMNGYNGQFDGNNILSMKKTSTFGGIMGAVAAIAIGAAVAPTSLPAIILLRVALGSSLSAMFSALYARMHNAGLDYSFQENKKTAEDNKRFPDSEADVAMRKAAENANIGPQYVYDRVRKTPVLVAEVVEPGQGQPAKAPEMQQIIQQKPVSKYPEEYCNILGLDANADLTTQDVDRAYNTQISRHRSGFFTSEIAQRRADENMRRMIEARDELGEMCRTKRHN